MSKTGIDIKYSTKPIEWFDNELPLRDPSSITTEDVQAMADTVLVQQEMELFGMDWYDPTCNAIKTLNDKYEKVDTDKVVDQLEHLSPQQQEDLKAVMRDHTKNSLMEIWVYIPIRNSILT